MTTITDVATAMQAALVNQTDAAGRVAVPGDLPTQSDQFPILKLRVVSESKTPLGRGTPQFNTLVTIRVLGEVSEPVDPDDDLLVATIQAKLLALKTQIERAIINSYPLFRIVQQLASVQTQFAFTASAQRLAGIQSDYAFEIYEGPEDFAPVDADDLEAVDLDATHYPPAGFAANLQP